MNYQNRITEDDIKNAYLFCENVLKKYNIQKKRFHLKYFHDDEEDDFQEIRDITSIKTKEELLSQKEKLQELYRIWQENYNSISLNSKNIQNGAIQLILTIKMNRIRAWLENIESNNFENAYFSD